MKKMVLVCVAAILAATLLSGCSWFTKANGLILYGDEAKITAALEEEKDEDTFVGEDQYEVKVVEAGEERTLVLSEGTAQALADKELLRTVTTGVKTEPVEKVTKLSQGEAVVYAKSEPAELGLAGVELASSYGGNTIIGDARSYADKFLVVAEADWAAIEGDEKSMAVMEYDMDPSIKLLDFDVDDSQLVRIVE